MSSSRSDYTFLLAREALFRLGKQDEYAIAQIDASDADESVSVLIGAGAQNVTVSLSYGDLDSNDLQAAQILLADRIADAVRSGKSADEPEAEADEDSADEAAPRRRRR